MGWLGFIVRKSILPYTREEIYTGRTDTVLDDDGVLEEIPEIDYLYEPKFSAIEEIKVIIVDGYQNSWEGIASTINPRGETVILRTPLP